MQNTKPIPEKTPDDLMSLKEIQLKHGVDYNFLYKWSIEKGEIATYFRGCWKLSEGEVLEYCKRKAEEKLKRIRSGQGNKIKWQE